MIVLFLIFGGTSTLVPMVVKFTFPPTQSLPSRLCSICLCQVFSICHVSPRSLFSFYQAGCSLSVSFAHFSSFSHLSDVNPWGSDPLVPSRSTREPSPMNWAFSNVNTLMTATSKSSFCWASDPQKQLTPKEEKTPTEPLNQAPDWTHHFRKVGTLLQWVSSFIPLATPETSITLLVSHPSCPICDNILLVLRFSIFSLYFLFSILTAAVFIRSSSLLCHVVTTS